MTEPSPWTVLESQTLIEDRWISLRADRLRNAAGEELTPWYVLAYPDWAVVVPLTADDRLVLIRQWRHAVQNWCLELPGGVIDAGDADAIAAGRRELLEETGHAAQAWRHLYAAWPNPAIQTNRLHVLLAKDVTEVAPVAHEPGESIRVEAWPVADVLAAITEGAFGQAMHVGAILAGLAAAGRIRV
ncbi:NUDIX hydrolase [Falsiroseomonas sp.]|uniref:NUDIX hydrolase n=1 Tax=Falsiroseomonas sp. TaxID=2870721 RepID=UPI00356532D5